MRFDLPQNIKFVLDTLIKNGHKAYIVGGCVRDFLCDKTPHDFDITTSALPSVTQSLFDKTVDTGLKHGTVTVIVNNTPIEVTTFRTESIYTDSRHPESVNFVTDVKDDLARRDFTVNAMCYNDVDGLIDVFDGQDDIKNQILRAVGNAETRFTEDALRILRLFRFASTLQFNIEQQTLTAAIKCAPLLKNISAERIFTELKKASCGNNVSVLSSLLITNCLADYCIFYNDVSKIKNLKHNENLRTFALLYTTSNNLEKTLDMLKCSNNFKDYCLKMAYHIENGIKDNKISLKNALNYSDYSIVCNCLSYFEGILNINTENQKVLLNEIITGNEPYKISHLDITGKDIIALGFKGEEVGEKLNFLLNKVIENPAFNVREKLLNLICN